MTLTHILPTLRRTLADPISRDSWPEYTSTTPDDVTIAGLSLVTLVVVRVTSTEVADGRLNVWIDGELDGCAAIESETRMIGRVSSAHAMGATIHSLSAHTPVRSAPELPGDLRAGDLLAIPCRGVTVLRDVQGRSWHPELLSDDRVDHGRDDVPSACGK
jgi:hypothetical protein